MEDRKFADIGNTCKLQLGGGAYRIADWADMVTAHALPGPSILNSLAGVAVVLVAEMSSEGKLTTTEYSQGNCTNNWNNFITMVTATAQMAVQHPGIVVGVVSQQKLLNNTGQLHFTPGVTIMYLLDSLEYKSPPNISLSQL